MPRKKKAKVRGLATESTVLTLMREFGDATGKIIDINFYPFISRWDLHIRVGPEVRFANGGTMSAAWNNFMEQWPGAWEDE
jgi:hypothetical protein